MNPRVPIHVLLVNASPHVFGAEKSLARLAALVQDERFEFSLLSPGGATERYFQESGIRRSFRLPLDRLCKTRNPISLCRQLFRLARGQAGIGRLLRRERPDLVHANGLQSMILAAPAAFVLARPIIWHIRDLGEPAWALRACAFFARAMIAPSQTALRGLDPARAQLLPNPAGEDQGPAGFTLGGAMTDGGEHPAPRELCAQHACFRIGLIGQMIPRKGHDLLLEALPAILSSLPRARLFFVGSDLFNSHSAYAARLRKTVQDSPVLAGRVSFLPYTQAMGPVYRALDAVVLPSRREAFGRVALEAMQAGCPVAAARTGGLAELIRHGGKRSIV